MQSLAGAALLIVGVSAAAAAVEPPSARIARLNEYIQAVRTHEPGGADAALYTVASWSNDQIGLLWLDVQTLIHFVHCGSCNGASVRGLNDRVVPIRYSKSEIIALHELAGTLRERRETDEILKRGAILHADVVMIGHREGDLHVEQPPQPGQRGFNPLPMTAERIILKSIDGRQDHLFDAAVHWEIAYALLDRIPTGQKPAPQEDPTVRQWYHATIAYLQDTAMHDSVHFDRALRLFPNDAEVLFQAGCLHETLASSRVQAVLRSATIPSGLVMSFGSERAELEAAERFFRRALTVDPSRQEARLRLGRVLALLDRHEQAAAELRQVTDDVDHVALRYYTALFLGREEEMLGRRDAAREAYERAAAMFPLAQSPLIALSHLARDAGERDRALASIQRVLELPLNEMDRRDPFWVYHFIQARHLDELLDQLHRPFRHKERSP
jgi:tetratricopeptide (TPR) repeat protein